MTAATTPPAAPAVPAARVTALRVLAGLLLLGVILQAVFAGGFVSAVYSAGESGWAGALTPHEIGANATFLVVVLQFLNVVATPAFRDDRKLLVGVIVLGVTLTAIIGLGYVGGGALQVHIPLAVVVAVAASDHLRSTGRVATAVSVA